MCPFLTEARRSIPPPRGSHSAAHFGGMGVKGGLAVDGIWEAVLSATNVPYVHVLFILILIGLSSYMIALYVRIIATQKRCLIIRTLVVF